MPPTHPALISMTASRAALGPASTVALSTIFSATYCCTRRTHPSSNLVRPAAATPDDCYDDDDDSEARSQFGTRQYWDDTYAGFGDFPADEYSWYYGFEGIKPHLTEFVPDRESRILVPGVGNDPLLLDLHGAGYQDLAAFDYSPAAVERQMELLECGPVGMSDDVDLRVMDMRSLDPEWTEQFDAIIEKGALDAVYLSGEGNVERAAEELRRVIRVGGICISVSGVVPENVRKDIFSLEQWEWLRDGGDDLKAGCFIWRRR